MPTRIASAVWEGNFPKGNGMMKLGSGAFEGNYSFSSRFENGEGSNPEELIGAAHAGCFSMEFASQLASAGYSPKHVKTSAKVNLAKAGDNYKITEIELNTEAKVPNIDESEFMEIADIAKKSCPVSQLVMPGTEVKLRANLIS